MRDRRRVVMRAIAVGLGLAAVTLTVPTFAASPDNVPLHDKKNGPHPTNLQSSSGRHRPAPASPAEATPAKKPAEATPAKKEVLPRPDGPGGRHAPPAENAPPARTTPPAPPVTEGPGEETTAPSPDQQAPPAPPQAAAEVPETGPPLARDTDNGSLSTTLLTTGAVMLLSGMLLLAVLWRLRRTKAAMATGDADQTPTALLPPGVGAELARLIENDGAASPAKPVTPEELPQRRRRPPEETGPTKPAAP